MDLISYSCRDDSLSMLVRKSVEPIVFSNSSYDKAIGVTTRPFRRWIIKLGYFSSISLPHGGYSLNMVTSCPQTVKPLHCIKIWREIWQPGCRSDCQISERLEDYKNKYRVIKTLPDLLEKQPIVKRYWNHGESNHQYVWFCCNLFWLYHTLWCENQNYLHILHGYFSDTGKSHDYPCASEVIMKNMANVDLYKTEKQTRKEQTMGILRHDTCPPFY